MPRSSELEAQARRRVADLKRMTDGQLYDTYTETIRDPRNIDFSPYLVTAVRDGGLWERIAAEESRREEAARR